MALSTFWHGIQSFIPESYPIGFMAPRLQMTVRVKPPRIRWQIFSIHEALQICSVTLHEHCPCPLGIGC